jgi:hypothetical protein
MISPSSKYVTVARPIWGWGGRRAPCRAQDRGAELVEEDEGADHPALGHGQHPADLEAVAQILDPGEDRHLDRIAFHGAGLRGHGHGRSLLLG